MAQDPPKKVDRRVLYTKMFLRESLLELLREKPISRITPTELCRRAGINRNTFYSHYPSPEALLCDIEEDLFRQVRGSLERISSGQEISLLIAEICVAIAENYDLCRILLSENGDARFLERLINLAHDQTLLSWSNAGIHADEAAQETLYAYAVHGSVAVIRAWVCLGMPQSPHEIADQLNRMTQSGLSGFFG